MIINVVIGPAMKCAFRNVGEERQPYFPRLSDLGRACETQIAQVYRSKVSSGCAAGGEGTNRQPPSKPATSPRKDLPGKEALYFVASRVLRGLKDVRNQDWAPSLSISQLLVSTAYDLHATKTRVASCHLHDGLCQLASAENLLGAETCATAKCGVTYDPAAVRDSLKIQKLPRCLLARTRSDMARRMTCLPKAELVRRLELSRYLRASATYRQNIALGM